MQISSINDFFYHLIRLKKFTDLSSFINVNSITCNFQFIRLN